RWIELLPTAAGYTSTCTAIVEFRSVCVIVLDTVADSAASAVRGGGICTSAAVTPSTTAVIPSSIRIARRRRPGPVSAGRDRTSLREYAATAIAAAASPALTRISRPYVLET